MYHVSGLKYANLSVAAAVAHCFCLNCCNIFVGSCLFQLTVVVSVGIITGDGKEPKMMIRVRSCSEYFKKLGSCSVRVL